LNHPYTFIIENVFKLLVLQNFYLEITNLKHPNKKQNTLRLIALLNNNLEIEILKILFKSHVKVFKLKRNKQCFIIME